MKKYFIGSLLLSMSLLQADYLLKYSMDGNNQLFMYHSDTTAKMVIDGEGQEKSIYKIGKKVYLVSSHNGKKVVMDMDKLKQLQKAMGFDAS